MTPMLAARPPPDRAFERLYQRHVGDVYRYSLAVMRAPADAEDVTQTTFLNAYRAFARGERPQKPQNWLIAIAHNVCRQRFRQAARRPSEVTLDEDVAEAIVPDGDAPSASDIQRALSHLAFNQRSALVMRELEDRSYAEIAEALGVSLSAVETLLFRARRALREQLEGALTCHEAELAISRQLDGKLLRAQRGPLRAHLRECPDCGRLARSQRAQRSAWKALSVIPLPASLGSFFGGGAAVTAAGGTGFGAVVAAKTAAVVVSGALVAGASYEAVKHPVWRAPAKPARATAAPPRPVAPAVVPTPVRPTVAERRRTRPAPRAAVQKPVPASKAKPARAAERRAPVKARRAKVEKKAPRPLVAVRPHPKKARKAKPAHPAHAAHAAHAARARGKPSAPRGHGNRKK